MINKKAQFFSIYLVLLTLFMCGIVILFYHYQNKSVANSLVSPLALLELEDKKELFEIQENQIILASAEKSLADGKWGDAEFFKINFFKYLISPEQEQFRNFLFLDISSVDNQEDFPEEIYEFFGAVYKFEFTGETLKVTRKPVGKRFDLRASDRASKINFPVYIDYTYGKSYLISKGDIK